MLGLSVFEPLTLTGVAATHLQDLVEQVEPLGGSEDLHVETHVLGDGPSFLDPLLTAIKKS